MLVSVGVVVVCVWFECLVLLLVGIRRLFWFCRMFGVRIFPFCSALFELMFIFLRLLFWFRLTGVCLPFVLVFSLSSPFGDAASSVTRLRMDAVRASSFFFRLDIHSPSKYRLSNLMITSAALAASDDRFVSNAATSTCFPISFTACIAG